MHNKHIIVAVLVAPLLALLAWWGVGKLAGEKPAPAVPGETYPLVEKSNCRYASGECTLENNDLELRLTASIGDRYALVLTASHPLDSVLMSVTDPARDPGPRVMQKLDDRGLRWRQPMQGRPQDSERIRLVAGSRGSAYYAEASTAFLQAVESQP